MNSKAQIVVTLGPATKDREIIKQMMMHQMDIVRLNFSWGNYTEHEGYIKTVREVARELGKIIPIIQDLSGPRIQIGATHVFDSAKDSILTEKDLRDLDVGIKQKVDYIAMSYVGDANDVLTLIEEIKKRGADIPVISKIERKKALDNIDEIINVSDGIMIARGDLGEAIPIEQIPFVEKDIIEKCKSVHKPVITATQMMISMTDNIAPTRAEITDIAYAIMNGSDAVMLSEETAIGKYPVEVVKIMERVILESEKHLKNFIINPLHVKIVNL